MIVFFAQDGNIMEFKRRLRETRYFTYLISAPWKIFVFFCTMVFSVWFTGGDETTKNLFNDFYRIFDQHVILVSQVL